MGLLKDRRIAFIVTVLMIAASTLLSVNRSLGALCMEVTDTFYTGVYDSARGMTERSIDSQLTKQCDAANLLLTVAANHSELSEETANLRAKRISLIGAGGVTEKYNANIDLQNAFYELYAALEGSELSDRDKEMMSECGGTFRGAQNLINDSGYNEAVREFERTTLDTFPANILKGLAGVKAPENFG